ncbi:unnamed protein product, partial [marine sediment metagenome]
MHGKVKDEEILEIYNSKQAFLENSEISTTEGTLSLSTFWNVHWYPYWKRKHNDHHTTYPNKTKFDSTFNSLSTNPQSFK